MSAKPERNYLDELNTDLGHIFGDFLRMMSLNTVTPDVISKSRYAAHNISGSYTLELNIEVSVTEMLKMKNNGVIKSSVDFNSLVCFGSYIPDHQAQTQDYKTGTMSMVLVYQIHDLEDFLKELHKRAWIHYNACMNDEIDKVLEESSD